MTYLSTAILVLIGGGIGSGCRYLVSEAVRTHRGQPAGLHFPLATFLVNAAGSFLLGIVAGLADLESAGAVGGLALAGVGFCGGFTTYSTFAVDLVVMVEGRAWRLLAGTVGANVLGCLALAALGFGIVLLFG